MLWNWACFMFLKYLNLNLKLGKIQVPMYRHIRHNDDVIGGLPQFLQFLQEMFVNNLTVESLILQFVRKPVLLIIIMIGFLFCCRFFQSDFKWRQAMNNDLHVYLFLMLSLMVQEKRLYSHQFKLNVKLKCNKLIDKSLRY